MRTVQKCAESVGAATHWYHAEDIHCGATGTRRGHQGASQIEQAICKAALAGVEGGCPTAVWLGINYLNWKDLKIIHAEEQRENDNCG